MGVVITKVVTVCYVYAGIKQYVEFRFVGDELYNPTFHPNYVSKEDGDIPSMDGVKSVEEAIELINKFTKNKRGGAYVHLINYEPVCFYAETEIKEDINLITNKVKEFLRNELLTFLTNRIIPILLKNNWKITYSWCGVPVLIYFDNGGDGDGEYKNVIKTISDYQLIDYSCYKILHNLGIIDKRPDLQPENASYFSCDGIKTLFGYISEEKLTELGIFVKID